MSRFISFLRFVEFDENIAHLYTLKGQWSQRTRPNPEDSDDYEPPNFYTAEDVPVISKQNERKVWLRIKSMAEEYLGRYPNTYEEDLVILERDNLTFNESNCTLFRSGEKEILLFMIELANYVLNVLEMKFKDAKKHTQTLPKKMESCRDYLQTHVVKLLATNNAD